MTVTYTVRGERYSDSRDGLFVAKPLYANGLAIVGDSQGYDQWTWDARRAVLTSAVNKTDQLEQPWGFQYDAAGRQLSASQSQAFTPHQGEEVDCQMTLTRQYDADNHVTGGGEAAPTAFASGRCGALVNSVYRYVWGGNGHPVRMGAVMGTNPSNVNFDSLHWDGDQLLFTTNPYGQVDDIKLGDQADVTPLDPTFTGLTFWDHVDGIQAFCHNSTGSGGLDTNDTRLLTRGQRPLGCLLSGNNQMKVPSSEIFTADYPMTSATQMVGQGAILGMLRSDGIDDGYTVIQGVRSYDPSAGTWTTPDAYAGRRARSDVAKGFRVE